ncbi:hypothetical protein PGT21_022663 [Puccinia graminis f. sp. tritici]|uniref:No apical meristem-associated C-terminal domain-containing protein n=1 Tax=Puccinia graminis f. sp. tritici TaxID=56615 RepID=A0A5B0P954_PUCGR|nr:hypothetical protein PGT21_022663 [Puccinia graminis f. sp. tritici]
MTIDPLQSISDSIKNSSNNQNPNPSNSTTPALNPSQNPLPSHPPQTSDSGPKKAPQPGPPKANPPAKTAENRPQSQTNPSQTRRENGNIPKGLGTSHQLTKTAAALNTEQGLQDVGSQEPQTVAVIDSAALKIKARNVLLAKAIKAQEEGDDDKSDRFFAMYDVLLKVETQVVAQDVNEIQIINNPTVIPQKRPSAAGEITESKGIKFQWGTSNSHDDGGGKRKP